MTTFDYREPTLEQIMRIRSIGDYFKSVDAYISILLKPCRETSLYQQKIEEAAMWAVKSITVEETGENE